MFSPRSLSISLFTAAVFFCTVPALAQHPPDIARRISDTLGFQERMLWVDGTANIFRTIVQNGQKVRVPFTTTDAGVQSIVAHCKAAHINTIVVDVKPLGGEVLYNSSFAPHLREWQGLAVPDFDVLAAFIKYGHEAGIQIDADVNLLSEGHKYYSTGPAYAHPDWQVIDYTVDRGLVAPNGARLPIAVADEPSDNQGAMVAPGDQPILGGSPAGRVGLDVSGGDLDKTSAYKNKPVGQQINIAVGQDGRVEGIVDSGLLGDALLSRPEGGTLITVTASPARQWVAQNLAPGAPVRFDLRTPMLPVAQAPYEKVACFVNPLDPAVRQYELDMVKEIVSKYDIDGLVLDRCRYADLYTDFSDTAHHAFEQFLGHPVVNWPQDVFRFSPLPGGDLIPGPFYKPWLTFRATVIREMVRDVARTMRSVKPGIALGTYVGSWYPGYYPVGVNWGSPDTPLHYGWFPPGYRKTGYAEYFNWVSTGCYYPIASEEDALRQGRNPLYTVEAAAQISRAALANGTLLYPGLYLSDYEGHPQAFLKALEAAGRGGEGWMIFDLSYIEDFHWWPLIEQAMHHDRIPPEKDPALLTAIRTARSAALP